MLLTTSDGVRLSASYDPGPPGTCFVLAHGFTGSWQRPAVRRAATIFARHGGVVSFDFRGHGKSGGRSTVGDLEVHDLAAAVLYAQTLGYPRIATVGFSMGASVAVRHAALVGGVAAVAAVSGPARWYYRGTTPMRRVHWVIERRTGRLFSRIVLRTRIAADGWDPVPPAPHEVVEKISPTPLLVVHGDADAYFPVEHAQQLFEAALEPKELWLEPGFGHAENAAPDALLERIAVWLLAA
jgi:pimeloyl-ACP methyl ester carboxylesterase